jgi:VanZ family protein
MIRLYRIAFWAAMLVAFTMAALPHPPMVPVWDKLQHMTAFVVLTLIGCLAYPRASRVKLTLGLVAFGGLIELVQMIPALGRDSDWHDWLADIFAVALALGGIALFRRALAPRPD